MPEHYSSKANEKKIKKALKDGKLTKKQVEKLPEKLVIGIANSKKKNPKKTKKK